MSTEEDFICRKCKNGGLYFDDVFQNGKTSMRYKCETCEETVWIELTPVIDLDYHYAGEINEN